MRHILVPLDGSSGGQLALKKANEIATEHDAILHIVKRHQMQEVGVRNADSTFVDLVDSYTLEAERSYLDCVSVLPERDGRIERAIIEGPTFFAYDTYMRDNLIDLVVLSAGSRVADTLLRTLSVMTLVLPRTGDLAIQQQRPMPQRPGTEPPATPHVLCAVGPAGSVRKLSAAAAALRPRTSWQYVECRATPASDATRLDPAAHILSQCRQCGAELIVMASHWRPHRIRGGVSGVCRAVVREAQVPVLVVPS